MEGMSPLTPLRKKKALKRKLTKILKQQQHLDENKEFLPGKIQINETNYMKPHVVNFFGDVHTEVFCLNVCHNNKYVTAGCDNGDVKVYNIQEGKLMMMGNTSRLSGYPNTGIRWRPKSQRQFAACNCDGTIKWYDLNAQSAFAHHEGQTGYLCVDYNCSGSWSAFGTEKHEIQIFDSETHKMLMSYPPGAIDLPNPNHTNRIFSLKSIDNDPNIFYTGGWDSTIRVWDVRVSETYVRKFTGPSISSDSLDLKDNVLLVGNYSNKNTVQLWDFKSGQLIQDINIKQEENGSTYCFGATYNKKSEHNLMAVALSGANKVKIFKDKQIVSEFKMQAAPLTLDFCSLHSKDCILVSGIEGVIYLIKLRHEGQK